MVSNLNQCVLCKLEVQLFKAVWQRGPGQRKGSHVAVVIALNSSSEGANTMHVTVLGPSNQFLPCAGHGSDWRRWENRELRTPLRADAQGAALEPGWNGDQRPRPPNTKALSQAAVGGDPEAPLSDALGSLDITFQFLFSHFSRSLRLLTTSQCGV